MTTDISPQDLSAALCDAIDRAERGLVGRRSLVELVLLAAVAGEHLLVIGPPGTAKSAAVRRVADQLGGRYFEYLLSRFTEPSELFGSVDLRKLREGQVEVQTTGMLPEADVAFLDEVFLGSTAILNNLLSLLNERRFRHGHTDKRVPLRVCVGASNALPDEESLAAFADRFLLRTFVEPIEDGLLESLLEEGFRAHKPPSAGAASLPQLDALAAMVDDVDMAGVRPRLADAARTLRNAGIVLSDRRLVKLQRVVAAACLLSGRTTAGEGDLWPLIFAVPTQDDQLLARELLRDQIDRADNATLRDAAESASAGPLARAARLTQAARELLAQTPEGEDAVARHRLRLEAIAREIDAGFDAQTLPAGLATERERIVQLIQAAEPAKAAAVVVRDAP